MKSSWQKQVQSGEQGPDGRAATGDHKVDTQVRSACTLHSTHSTIATTITEVAVSLTQTASSTHA